METSLHAHLIAIHIQERSDRAAAERRAREVRAASKPVRRRVLRVWRPKVVAAA